MPTRLRTSRLTTALAGTAAVLAAAALTLTAAGGSLGLAAGAPAVPAPPASPTDANQIQNLDQVKTAIKGYYGDTPSGRTDPINHSTVLHEPSIGGAWRERTRVVGLRALDDLESHYGTWADHPKKRAVVLDVDDTSLVTYDYEIYSNFVYDPTTNAAFVNAATFPGIGAISGLANNAVDHGIDVFFVTGRPESQRTGTMTNLDQQDFPQVPSAHVFLKDQANQPWLASCSPSCTTVQYKSLTRQHIQDDLGYKIVANVGDQFSDLEGGFANKTYKMPNPMYYLP